VSGAFRGFRFTIGQGMAVIAALAVLFAVLPLTLAINVALATAGLVAIGRSRLFIQPLGCVLCFLGLLLGLAALEGWIISLWRVGSAVSWGSFAVCSFILASLGIALLRQPARSAKSSAPIVYETKAELRLVESLLRRANEDGDDVVVMKLTEYRAKLEHELQVSTSDT